MARANRVEFVMNSILQFKSVIRGHHVYSDIWTPVKDETVLCMEDEREEAKSFDKYAVGIFKDNVLVGHVPIEISRLIFYFLKSDSSANQCIR